MGSDDKEPSSERQATPSAELSAPRPNSRERVLAMADAAHKLAPAADLRIAQIAQDANVSPAMVIVHYRNKDALLFAAYLYWLEREFTPALEDWARTNPDADAIDVLTQICALSGGALHRLRDMLGSAHWWSATEAEQWDITTAPHRALVVSRLKGAYSARNDDEIKLGADLLHAAWIQCMREAMIAGFNLETFSQQLRAACRPVLEWLSDQ